MEIVQEILPGAFVLRLKRINDERGHFVKTHAESMFASLDLRFDFREEFYSVSHRGVVRGMHFQTPPHAHDKLVYCPAGEVEDVVLDLRTGPSFGRHASVRLGGDSPVALFIPSGIAHGFAALADNSLMVYKTSTEHAPANDAGIHWNSFGHRWSVGTPIVSSRDQQHVAFDQYKSAF